jgi:hypothetical protein
LPEQRKISGPREDDQIGFDPDREFRPATADDPPRFSGYDPEVLKGEPLEADEGLVRTFMRLRPSISREEAIAAALAENNERKPAPLPSEVNPPITREDFQQ